MKVIIKLEKLSTARIVKGLTINKAAKAAGVSVATFVAVESGKTIPRPETLVKMCKAVGCDPREVFEVRA